MQQPAAAARLVALAAAVAMTTLLVASQFGLASHYGAQADALLAQQAASTPVAQAGATRSGA